MALDSALKANILASVEAGFAEQVAFTQELIRFASVRGAEHACQDFVFRALRERGYVMDRFAMDREAIEAHPGGSPWTEEHSDAPIVVGIHHPREVKGRSLILQAHVDVVPAGPADMSLAGPSSSRPSSAGYRAKCSSPPRRRLGPSLRSSSSATKPT